MSPEAVTASFAHDLRDYGLRKVVADRWGASWVEERFLAEGISVDQSADPKSTIYGNFLPLLNSGRVRLLDNARLISQLVGLERRTARGGRDYLVRPRPLGRRVGPRDELRRHRGCRAESGIV
jgi:hypothetical protein